MGASAARKARYEERQRARQKAEGECLVEERPSETVPEPRSLPASEESKVDFTLPPDGMMGGRLINRPKTVIVPGALNAHLLMFQARYPGRRYKVQNGTLALWRVLLREEAEMQAEARRLQQETGLPVEPGKGPVMRRFEEELQRMEDEESKVASGE